MRAASTALAEGEALDVGLGVGIGVGVGVGADLGVGIGVGSGVGVGLRLRSGVGLGLGALIVGLGESARPFVVLGRQSCPGPLCSVPFGPGYPKSTWNGQV